MQIKRGFASDNNAGLHPRVWDALRSADRGHAVAYGDDVYTETAVRLFRELLGEDLWRETAAHANRMAQALASELRSIPQIHLTQPVESNAVFAVLPRE